MLDDLGHMKYFLLALLHMERMFLALFAAERALTDLTEVPSLLQGGRAAQTDGLGLLQGGTDHGRLLSQDDLPSLQVPGGHHVPPHLLALLHSEGFLAVRFVFRPVGLLTVSPAVSHGETPGTPSGGIGATNSTVCCQ